MSIRRCNRLAFFFVASLSLPAALYAANPTQVENGKPGSPDWQLTNPATNHEIEGYASLNSVNRGSQISFFVNTPDPTFTLEVFRMGWYGGAGARRVMAPVSLPGTKQTIPTPDPTTGIIEAQWINPYVLTVPAVTGDPTNWASGVYLVRLTGSVSAKQSFIIFVVRDDPRFSQYVFQLSVNTFQAYNNWGGKSLYPWNSTGGSPAINVSFNRPYAMGANPNSASGVGAGEFLTNLQIAGETAPAGWSYNLLRFLEREGYDVSYISDVDAHENGSLLTSHQAVLVVGHSEYWSWQMRTNLESARDSGIGLGFFSSNTCYWQIRFGPSALTGAADRTIIAYKDAAVDPYASNPALSYLTTTQWRNPPVNRPEDAFTGVMFQADYVNSDIVVTNASHWVYTFTGLQNGAHLPGMLGYEVDAMGGHQPSTTVGVAHELIGGRIPSDTTVYTTASGTPVFATGSFMWNWGLDDFGAPSLRPSVLSPAAQQITRNVLTRLVGSSSFTPALSIVPSPRVQSVTPWASVGFTVNTVAFGYSPTVTLSVTGLPPNVSASFAPATITGSGSSTLTISLSPSASYTEGTYLLTIGANDGVQMRTESVWLTILPTINQAGWTLVSVDSQETACESGAAVNAFDGLFATYWHTRYCPSIDPLPHDIRIDMGAGYRINAFRYVPRQDGAVNGRIGKFEFYGTNSLSAWGTPLATGTFDNDATEKLVFFPSNIYRYIRLRALSEANGQSYISVAELSVLSATGGGGPSISTLSLNPSGVTGGGSSQATVTLTGPAPSGGAVIALTSSNTAVATVPGSVTVASGATSAIVTVNTSVVGTATPVTISGSYQGTASAVLTVNPTSGPAISSLSLNPSTVTGGGSSQATVTLTGPAPSGGAVIALTSSNTAVATVQGSVTVASGATSAIVTVNTSVVGTATPVTISGSYQGTASAVETVSPQSVSTLSLNPSTVTGGSSSQATVTLTGPAPSGGAVIALTSSNTAAATVPGSATVASGATSAIFTVNTSVVGAATPVTIAGSYQGTSASAVLTVNVSGAPVPKASWTLVSVDSQETACENGAGANAFDGVSGTIWHTRYCPTSAPLPHEIQIDMQTGYQITAFRYLPRQDGGVNGRIGQFEFYATNNLSSWGAPLVSGTFANDATEKQVSFTPNTYRYIRLRALTEANGNPWTSMAELTVIQP